MTLNLFYSSGGNLLLFSTANDLPLELLDSTNEKDTTDNSSNIPVESPPANTDFLLAAAPNSLDQTSNISFSDSDRQLFNGGYQVAFALFPVLLTDQSQRQESELNFKLTVSQDSHQLTIISQPPVASFSQQFQQLANSLSLLNRFEDPVAHKIGYTLAKLRRDYQAHLEHSGNSLLQIVGDQVDIQAVAKGDTSQLIEELEALGLQNMSSFGQVVSVRVSLNQLDQIAQLNSLNFARPAYRPITRVGATTSQGDAALNADIARNIFEVDGTGITVGVLSDSYDRSSLVLTDAADDIASGDLPGLGNPEGFTTPVTVLDDSAFGPIGAFLLIDEGRGMMQLIHDVAPGAALAFHTAANGPADFANGILELINNAGADVVVDDIGYLDQPFFQDGIIAQAADAAFAQGVPYFSSAGNSGRDSYEDEFRRAGIIGNYAVHDFNPGAGVDITNGFILRPGESITLSFQWDEPFASAGGVGASGASNDIDIFLFRNNFSLVESGTDLNVGGDAFEILSYTNTTASAENLNLVVGRKLNVGGSDPGLIKWIDFDGFVTDFEYETNSSTSFGHPNAVGAAAVGAAFYEDTPRFGTNPALLEDFSSAGGTPILFDIFGNRLAQPEVRQKVDFVAPDGTNTTFFGSSDVEGDGFPNFFGTSAASPHAAAVAALMLEAVPDATPDDIYETLKNTALDMDDPFTAGFDVGFDNASGNGLIQANLAIGALVENTTTLV